MFTHDVSNWFVSGKEKFNEMMKDGYEYRQVVFYVYEETSDDDGFVDEFYDNFVTRLNHFKPEFQYADIARFCIAKDRTFKRTDEDLEDLINAIKEKATIKNPVSPACKVDQSMVKDVLLVFIQVPENMMNNARRVRNFRHCFKISTKGRPDQCEVIDSHGNEEHGWYSELDRCCVISHRTQTYGTYFIEIYKAFEEVIRGLYNSIRVDELQSIISGVLFADITTRANDQIRYIDGEIANYWDEDEENEDKFPDNDDFGLGDDDDEDEEDDD